MSAIFTAAVVVGFVSVVMGLILVTIDKVVNNYGEVELSINAGVRLFKIRGGGKLLTSLADQKLYLPSACGGRGSCGACKCKVNTDIGPLLPTELPWLSPQEQQEGVRLACQIKVKKSLELQIPESLFSIRQLSATVTKISDLTPDIKELVLTLAPNSGLEYQAGQYAQIEVPPYGELREATQRAYSISSNPAQPDCLEFVIRLVEGGAVTSYVHQRLKLGQSLNIVAPMGDFKVQPTNAIMVCIAAGSGMAPFKSIFADMECRGQLEQRELWYFFGAHADQDLYYLDWLGELARKHPKFHFVPSLTTPDPQGTWKGLVGRITDILNQYLKEQIPHDQPREGYLCGSPGLIDACVSVLKSNGISDEAIFFDKFA